MAAHYSSPQRFFQSILALVCLLALAACEQPMELANPITHEPYYQNPALLERAWKLPVAAQYKNGFEYQSNAAFCGPATAVNLFRSVGVNRYTQSNIFDHTEVWYWKARVMGMTLDEMAQLIAQNAPFEVTILRDLNPKEFREHLRKTNDPSYRYLINFTRAPLFGVDIGHHSPIGGYLEKEDLVFVLDVRDQYQPFLVTADRLYEAMNTVVSQTGKKRGLVQVRVAAQGDAPTTEAQQKPGYAATQHSATP